MDHPTYYDVLGVSPGADAAAIKRAFAAQRRATHPDTTGVASHVQFDLVQRAGEVLTDPVRRAAYDASLSARADPWAPGPPTPHAAAPPAP
ncbi:J domain-containing protein, partial [Cellulomonas hominis]|nr:J domain-containing protein [Cellulomonas hominis]